jgi:hypothetical protein
LEPLGVFGLVVEGDAGALVAGWAEGSCFFQCTFVVQVIAVGEEVYRWAFFVLVFIDVYAEVFASVFSLKELLAFSEKAEVFECGGEVGESGGVHELAFGLWTQFGGVGGVVIRAGEEAAGHEYE